MKSWYHKYLESIDAEWSASLNIELHSVKNVCRFISCGKTFVLLEKIKLLKPEFNREISEFVQFIKGNMYGKFCFVILLYFQHHLMLSITWQTK